MASSFHVLNSDQARFNGLHTAGESLSLGDVVKIDSSGQVVKTSASTDLVEGFVLPSTQMTYAPTSHTAASGDYVTVVQNSSLALISSDGYTGSPAVGDLLYPGPTGKLQLNGTKPIGRVLGFDTFIASEGTGYGTGSTSSMMRFEFRTPVFA